MNFRDFYWKHAGRIYSGQLLATWVITAGVLIFFFQFAVISHWNQQSTFLASTVFTLLANNVWLLVFWITFFTALFSLFLTGYLPVLQRLLRTPLFLQYGLHGVHYGFMTAIIFCATRNAEHLQSAKYFKGDFVVLSFLIAVFYVVADKLVALRVQSSKPAEEPSADVQSSTPPVRISVEQERLRETPVESEEGDMLGYSAIAAELIRALNLVDDDDISGRRLALYGASGAGKTSVLNLMKARLAEDYPAVRIVQFRPFLFKTETELTGAFFQTISDSIGKEYYLPGLYNLPESYMKLIYGVGESLKLKLTTILEAFRPQRTAEELSALIEDYVHLRNIKLVVVIDDLDRCSIRVRYLLFRLMEAVGPAKRINYIIAASANELLEHMTPSIVTLVD